jgi:hypothetical protein
LPGSLKGKLASIKTKCIIGTFHFLWQGPGYRPKNTSASDHYNASVCK